MSGLGAKKKRGRPKKVGKGILSSITKLSDLLLSMLLKLLEKIKQKEWVSNVQEDQEKIQVKKKIKKPKTRRVGRPRKGGALIAPGYSAGNKIY